MITWKDNEGLPVPTFHCECGEITEGFTICLKCNPQNYEVIGLPEDLERFKRMSKEKHNDAFMMIENLPESVGNMEFPFNRIKEENEILKDRSISVLYKEIWNEAIEAAAKEIEDSDDGKFQASKIRELKK